MSVAYRDAWAAVHPDEPGLTFDPRDPLVRAAEMSLELGRRIDYVLVRCGIHGPGLDVTDCARVFDEPIEGVWASDHFGVLGSARRAGPPTRPLDSALMRATSPHLARFGTPAATLPSWRQG